MDNRIAELRKENNLTLKELGEILGVRDNTLSQYETGKRNPQLGLLQEIANYFNVSIEYLTRETNKRDYKLENDKDAIRLIRHIKEGSLSYLDFSLSTSLKLAMWIINHEDLLGVDEYRDLLPTAASFIKTVSSENEVLKHYSKMRKHESEIIDKIDEKLILEEDYYGASPSQVLEFIEQSERISYEDLEQVMKYMQSLPDSIDE